MKTENQKILFLNLTNKKKEIMKKKCAYADLLLELGNKTTSDDHFEEMFSCLPPQLTNYEKEKGFNAFLVGEPYTYKFCKFAGKEVAVYACYATASNGTCLDVGYMSEAAFINHFIN